MFAEIFHPNLSYIPMLYAWWTAIIIQRASTETAVKPGTFSPVYINSDAVSYFFHGKDSELGRSGIHVCSIEDPQERKTTHIFFDIPIPSHHRLDTLIPFKKSLARFIHPFVL
jgi:hypothetical protein